MKYFLPCLFVIIGFSQCIKDPVRPQSPDNSNIFTAVTDPNYILDTLTVSVRLTKETIYGYFFTYDNLNRVTKIKYYEYIYNVPLYNRGTWTFNYQGSNNNPESMDQQSYNNFRVYFFYNANGSKNRDSLVSTTDPSIQAVRRYTYDSAFHFAVANLYYKGSLKSTLQDSATFTNYNCNTIYSKQISWSGNIPVTYEWFDNYYTGVDYQPNPFSKMNIFPALFLAPYLQLGYKVEGNMWQSDIIKDFVFQNNQRRYWLNDYATGGYNYIHIQSGEGETYDTKNRIIQKDFADSSGTPYNVSYHNRYYATYKYR
ncbi:hypothetical protein [Ferruginibacter sp.]